MSLIAAAALALACFACPVQNDACGNDDCKAEQKCEACLNRAPAADAGSVKGRIKSKYAKKYPMVVYIEKVEGQEFEPPEATAKMDQKGKVFVPRVLPVLKGTTVEFLNSDDFLHNVFSPDGEKYNLGDAGPGESLKHTFEKTGTYVQLCSLHPEMVAYIVVLDTPYFAVADEEGNFTIPNVPAGTHSLKIWCERDKVTNQMNKKPTEVTVEKDKEASVEMSP